jgi:hypothetical protein
MDWTTDQFVDNADAYVADLERRVDDAPDETVRRADDLLYVETREYDSLTSRVRSRIRIVDDDTDCVRGAFEFDVRVYAPVELLDLFERIGLTDVTAWGTMAGAPVTPETPRLVVSGRRPDDA